MKAAISHVRTHFVVALVAAIVVSVHCSLPLTLTKSAERTEMITTTRHCLCLFDIDRTLTGKQGASSRCPMDIVQEGVFDSGYGGGTLMLSQLAQALTETFCASCYLGIISAGAANGQGSPEREVLYTQLQEVDNSLSDDWSGSGCTVTSPLVTHCGEGSKQTAVPGILNWYKQNEGVIIADSDVHFFDDKGLNIEPFRGLGYNARQISCGTRDGVLGLCGAEVDEIVPTTGIVMCGEEQSAEAMQIDTKTLQPGNQYMLMNDLGDGWRCLDHAGGGLGANPCDRRGGNVWTVVATATPGIVRLKNDRHKDGWRCLDHVNTVRNVGLFACNDHGGNVWTVVATGTPDVVKLKNDRYSEGGFGQCLDHMSASGGIYVGVFPCDDHGGNEWTVRRLDFNDEAFMPHSAFVAQLDDAPRDAMEMIDGRRQGLRTRLRQPDAATMEETSAAKRSLCNLFLLLGVLVLIMSGGLAAVLRAQRRKQRHANCEEHLLQQGS